MANLQASHEIVSDKSKNAVVSTGYIKHGSEWLDSVVNTAVSALNGKADKTYVDAELAKKANTEALATVDAKVNGKADAGVVSQLQATVNTKADASTVAALSDRVTANTTKTVDLQSQIDNLVVSGTGDSNPEVAQARTDTVGVTHATLKTRIDTEVTNLKSDLNEIQESLTSVSEGNFVKTNLAIRGGNLEPSKELVFDYAKHNLFTSDLINVNGGEIISTNKNYKFRVCGIHKDGTYTTWYTGWVSYFIIPSNFTKIAVQVFDSSDPEGVRVLSDLYGKIDTDIDDLYKDYGLISRDTVPYFAFEQGQFTAHGEKTDALSNRIRTISPLYIDSTFEISVSSGYAYNVFKVAENGVFLRLYSDYTTALTLESGFYNLTLKAKNGSNLTPANSTAFKIKKVKEIKNELIPNYKGRPVIFDTDWWTDIDDALALRVLTWAEREGMLDLMGIVIDSVNSSSAVSLSKYLNHEGRSGLCFGLDYDGTDYGGEPPYHQVMINSWEYNENGYTSNSECMDSTAFYRKSLSSLPEGVKCDIICVGYLNAISKLMNSLSDSYSKLNGIDLIKEKVNRLYVMGGEYPTGRENNFRRNARAIAAAQNVTANFPTEIVFLGFEVASELRSGNTIKDTIGTDDLLYKGLAAMSTYIANNGTQSWDPLLTLLAAYDDFDAAGYIAKRGINSVDSDGTNTFTPNSLGNHYYVIKKHADSWYAYQLNNIYEKRCWKSRKLGKYQVGK